MDIQFGDQLVHHALEDNIPENRRASRVKASFDQRRPSTNGEPAVIQVHKPSFLESKTQVQPAGNVEYHERV